MGALARPPWERNKRRREGEPSMQNNKTSDLDGFTYFGALTLMSPTPDRRTIGLSTHWGMESRTSIHHFRLPAEVNIPTHVHKPTPEPSVPAGTRTPSSVCWQVLDAAHVGDLGLVARHEALRVCTTTGRIRVSISHSNPQIIHQIHTHKSDTTHL